MSLISYKKNIDFADIELPSSKSIYNRVLILKHLYNLNLNIKNKSESDDGLLLEKLIISNKLILNCQNAGTVIRFLTAYIAAKGNRKILTGSKRMKQRPIEELIDALNTIGADISYRNNNGYPPVVINKSNLFSKTINFNGSKSSQFLSALIMIGAKLKNGLIINIGKKPKSKPYIDMTVKLMKLIGFNLDADDKKIEIKEFQNTKTINEIEIEADWSAAAFWFEIVLFSKSISVLLKKLKIESLQGDAIIAKLSEDFGLKTTKKNNGILIEKDNKPPKNNTEYDFSNYPDLAPVVIVMLAASKLKAKIKGIETLKLKESDRSLALQNELKKCNVIFKENEEYWILDATKFKLKKGTSFKNYKDHRIAMALAPLACFEDIKMKTGDVCSKSYPHFWEDLQKAGFEIKD